MMSSVTVLVICIGLMAVHCMAIPLASLPKLGSLPKTSLTNKASSSSVSDLGSLPTNHAVGLAADPTDQNNLFYADETALYQFNKETGESSMVAGKGSTGLLAMRSAADGVGTSAAFKYITRIISRPSVLYIFDYDRLRKYDYSTKEVSTVVVLSSADFESYPITGVVSSDESAVYWTGMSKDDGHLVMSLSLARADVNAAEHITGGPTMVGNVEVSADGQYLLLADVDMAIVEKVKISDGSVSFVTKYGKPNFRPGAMAVNGDLLYVINREERSIGSYDITNPSAAEEVVCGKSCEEEITNPFDVTYDEASGQLFVLDGTFHPTLPTYIFSVKSIDVGKETVKGDNAEEDFAKLLQFYSSWFASINKD